MADLVYMHKDKWTDHLDAIRAKAGTQDAMTVDEATTAVAGISGGTDTSDATMTSGDQMLDGVTAYARGTKYTGTIPSKTSSDLTAIGATVTVPAGHYASESTKSVASGSATTPATSITANPSISVSSSGLITATVSGSQSVTPTVSAGYVSSGTAGTVSVSGSNTSQLSTQAAATITPTTSQQTAVAEGKYTTGAVVVDAMPTGTAGTPTASKGAVSNHSIAVTPSVTNSTGYITGGTKTGTAVTVAASELVSGNKAITDNGTNIDVTNYETVSVDVSGGSAAITITDTTDPIAGGTIRSIDAVDISNDTVTAAHLESGYTAHDASGTAITGTLGTWQRPAAWPDYSTLNLTGQSVLYFTYDLTMGDDINWAMIDVTTTSGNFNMDVGIIANNAFNVIDTNEYTSNGRKNLDLSSYKSSYDYVVVRLTAANSFKKIILCTNDSGRTNDLQYCAQPVVEVYGNSVFPSTIGQYDAISGGFVNCYYLRSFTVTNLTSASDAKHILRTSFDGCKSLENVKIHMPSSTAEMYRTFRSCNYLKYGDLEFTCSYEEQAFQNCRSIRSIDLSKVTFTGTMKDMFMNAHTLQSVKFKPNMTISGNKPYDSMFNGCTELTTVENFPTLSASTATGFLQYSPAPVSLIFGGFINSNTTNISNLLYGKQLPYMDTLDLSSIDMSGIVNTSNAFYTSPVKKFVFPATLSVISSGTFQYNYGTKEYHFKSTTPPTLGNTNAFQGIDSNCKIYVPSASLSTYQSASNWSTYASYMVGE